MNWNDLLSQYTNRALGLLAQWLGVDEYANRVNPSNRQRAIEQFRRTLGRPDVVRNGLEKIGPAEINIVKEVARLGGHANTELVLHAVERETVLRAPMPEAPPTPDYQGIPTFEDACARAFCCGLVFSRDNHEIELKPGKQLLIPEPVLRVLNIDPVWKKTLERTSAQRKPLEPVASIGTVLTQSAADFQRDLSRYLRLVRRQGSVAVTTQGWIYKTNFKAFLAALNAPADAPGDEASNARLWFMRRLLHAAGEVNYDEAKFSANPAGQLLTTPVAQRIKLTFETWCDTGAWNELNRIPTEHQGYDYRRDAPPELARARAAILRMTARLVTTATSALTSTAHDPRPRSPAGSGDLFDRWMTTSQLVELVRQHEYQFLFPRKYLYRDFMGTTGYYNTPYYSTNNPYNMTFPAVHDERKGWDMVERQFIVHMLTGPMYWMGLVSLGYAKDATPGEGIEPVAFHLTDVGAWLLGLADEPKFVESGGRVLVQPNFTIIAMEPVSDAVLIALDEFAESQGGDRAVTYHLTRQSVYRGQKAGWSAGRIREFLEQHQGMPLPTNLQRSLEEWQAQHQRITFHRSARVLQYADDAARLGAHQSLDPLGLTLQRLAPAFEIVDRDPTRPVTLEQINIALSEAGWMPLLTAADTPSTDAEGVLTIDDAGDVQFKHAVPSLYATSQLQPFSEYKDGRWRITAPSVRAAMSRGLVLDQLLATLAHLHAGPLPGRFEASIRAWAGFYGDATIQPMHIVELSSADVLNNLLHDEQIGPYLKPIEGSVKPLALVEVKHVDRVRAVLTERGVTLHEA